MAVIVQVPDEHMSRLAKRLIGRRSGVRVVISGKQNRARTGDLRDSDPPRKILIVDDAPLSASQTLDLLNSGVWAVLPAVEADVETLLRNCVDQVRSGSSPLLSKLAGDRAETEAFFHVLQAQAARRGNRGRSGRANPLSERETQILQRIAQGVTSAEIATEMGFQLQTVKNKVTTILTKTEARSRTHAVAIAITNGWIRGG